MNYEKARGWWGPHSLFLQFQRGILSTWCLFQNNNNKKTVCIWRIWIKPQFTYSRWGYRQLTRATCWLIGGAHPLGCFLAHWGWYLYWAQCVLILPKTMLNNSKDLAGNHKTRAGQLRASGSGPNSSHRQGPLTWRSQSAFTSKTSFAFLSRRKLCLGLGTPTTRLCIPRRTVQHQTMWHSILSWFNEIGRASCRERV